MNKAIFCLLALFVAIDAYATIEFNEDATSPCVCSSGREQSIVLRTSGEAGPFSFQWEGPNGYASTEESLYDVTAPGTYSVTVTNAFGCETILSREMPECEPLEINIPDNRITHPTTCDAENGVINLRINVVSGGMQPYRMKLYGADGVEMPGSASSNVWENLAAGEYNLVVEDYMGCTEKEKITLYPQDGSPQLTTQVLPECAGQQNGFIEVVPHNGVNENPVYILQWSTGATVELGEYEPYQMENLNAGDYCVTVTLEGNPDACVLEQCFTVESLSAQTPLTITNVNYSDFICPDQPYSGWAGISVTGGVRFPQQSPDYTIHGYKFQWSSGNFNGPNRTFLRAGNHCVTVTDYCGGRATACFEIKEYPEVRAFATVGNTCVKDGVDLQLGNINIDVTSGVPPYNIDWYNQYNNVIPFASGENITGLRRGVYRLKITDINGCVYENSYVIGIGYISCVPDDIDCRYEDCYCDNILYQDNRFIGTYRDLDFEDCSFYSDYCILTGERRFARVANAPLCLSPSCSEDCALNVLCENGQIYSTIYGTSSTSFSQRFQLTGTNPETGNNEYTYYCYTVTRCQYNNVVVAGLNLGSFSYVQSIEDGASGAIIDADGTWTSCNIEVFCYGQQVYDSDGLDPCGYITIADVTTSCSDIWAGFCEPLPDRPFDGGGIWQTGSGEDKSYSEKFYPFQQGVVDTISQEGEWYMLGEMIRNGYVTPTYTEPAPKEDTLHVYSSSSESYTNNIKISPNPSDGKLTIKINQERRESTTVNLVNLNGKIIHSFDIVNPEEDYHLDLTRFNIPPGIYFFRILWPNGMTDQEKFIYIPSK